MCVSSLAWLSWGSGIGTALQMGKKGPTCLIFLLSWMLCFISSKNLIEVELHAGCGVPGLELETPGGSFAGDSSIQGSVSLAVPWLRRL